MKYRNVIAGFSLIIILVFGLTAVYYAFSHQMKTYDGSDTNVLELYENPEDYDVSDAEGIAEIIVEEDLSKTEAVNNVAAVVFDYRGFDTMGESFILLTAIAGAYAIMRKHYDKKKEEGDAQ